MSAEILKNAYRSSTYLTMSSAELEGLFEISHKFVSSSIAQRSVSPVDLYDLIELEFYLGVLTGHDTAARAALTTLVDRFGMSSARVAVLRGVFIEVSEGPVKALEYLSTRPDYELAATKRRLAILKSTGEKNAFVKELLVLVETFPSDGESWAELAAAYVESGMYAQAVFALHEVLLLFPLAYNVNAIIGETLYEFGNSLNGSQAVEKYIESVKYFSRSVELCEDYVRGWIGILNVSKKINGEKYQKLNEIAKSELTRIVKEKEASEVDLNAAKIMLRNSN
ncbi:hypothetical protein V1512DRAFT_265441 [Lipomyces arxii]|uniref:uncharacterized protein n=1 Tax=Lipomyces arxii TaxID=56418 RepID=UPI0034CFBE50